MQRSTFLLFEASSLLAGIDSLVPVAGNSLLALRIGWGILVRGWVREPNCRSLACTFPAYQGSARGDEFESDSPPAAILVWELGGLGGF